MLIFLGHRRRPSNRKSPVNIDFNDSDKENVPPAEGKVSKRTVAGQHGSEASISDQEDDDSNLDEEDQASDDDGDYYQPEVDKDDLDDLDPDELRDTLQSEVCVHRLFQAYTTNAAFSS